MRWKLVGLVSLICGLIAFGLWELIVALWLGRLARPVFVDNRILFLTSVVPLLTAAASAFFVYRHTSKRRRLQAILSFLMTLAIAAASFSLGSRLLPGRLGVTRNCRPQPCV